MRAYILRFPIDENSNEEREVLVRNISIGKINVGLYSKWYNNYLKNGNPTPIDVFIIRFLYETYGYVVKNSNDVTTAKEELNKKISLVDTVQKEKYSVSRMGKGEKAGCV